jgi:chorismate synthase
MSSSFGQYLKLSLFGESHGVGLGIVIDGLPPGLKLDMEEIGREMARRAPGRNDLSTLRRESDTPEILSGLYGGKTTGAPLAAVIRSLNTRSEDYGEELDLPRPGHADYTGYVRYGGFGDHRGGGHFSGRLTAPVVFAGAVCKQWLKQNNIRIHAHIQRLAGIEDGSFLDGPVTEDALDALKSETLPLLHKDLSEKMSDAILNAKSEEDSVGGVVECMVQNLPAGLGAPFFDSAESILSHLMFSIPAVKGVSFGAGFDMADWRGSRVNDPFYYDEQGSVRTKTNNTGGILGGITTGMPLVFRCAIRPTSSIARPQETVSLKEKENAVLKIVGRHDPCIVPRAVPVIEAMTAIGLCELWKEHHACRI